MRSISILSLAAATACAALVASSAADAGPRGVGYRAPAMHGGAGFHARPGIGYHRPAIAHRGWRGGYRHAYRGWGYNRGLGYAAGAAIAASAGYAAGSSYGYGSGYYGGDEGYAAPAADYGYASAGYGYAQPAQTWSRTYLVPRTVMRPVTRTHVVPVTTYRTVQSTAYVPTTVYNAVTKTCSCTINGVTQQVPCEGGYAGGAYGVGYGRGVIYNRPGLFTSGW
ncbi:MAG: hypothetical protein U1E30_04060 [Rhodoblastus sp.]